MNPGSIFDSLNPGVTGERVRELHQQLKAAGHPVNSKELSKCHYGSDTEKKISLFQRERGLHESGCADTQTLLSLIEASHRLGDRHLYLHAPMLRGDDVANLQLRLGNLGFDAGRIDGIFGPETSAALREFQQNCGLVLDGIAGSETIRSLHHLKSRTSTTTPVVQVRELDRLRHSRPDLDQRRIALGHFGSCGALTAAVSRGLRSRGANVVALDHPDDTTQATTANRFGAEVYLGLQIESQSNPSVAYFHTEGFHSEGGLQLAQRCAKAIETIISKGPTPPGIEIRGMRLTILRRTRMPAVLCTLAPPSKVVTATAELADHLSTAIADWVADPTGSNIT